MQALIDYILKNKEWMFSGIGVFVVSGAIWFFRNIFKFSILRRNDVERKKHTSADLAYREGMKCKAEKRDQNTLGHRFEFSDGVVAYAKLRGSWTLEDVILFIRSGFKDHDDFARKIFPLINARVCYLLEEYTFSEAKKHRREVEIKVEKELQAEFAKYGLKLDGITIGSFVRSRARGNN